MPWTEFSSLLAGINEDTALGKVIQIRAESRKDIISSFTPQQRRMRNEWRHSEAKRKLRENPEEVKRQIKGVQELFKATFGGN